MTRPWLCLAAVALVFGTSAPALAGAGGPDAYGYRWRDSNGGGATYSWIEIRATGTDLLLGDESAPATQALGFTMNFYGTNYTQIKISPNGWITFNLAETASSATNTVIPSVSGPEAMVAGMWDDLDPTDNGDVFFQSFGTYAVVEWDRVDRFGTNDRKTFEIVLYATGVIKAQYRTVGATLNTNTIGIENQAGTVGLQVLFDGAASGGFALANDRAVEFYIPAFLSCAGATVIACDTALVGQAMGPANNAVDYGCNALTYNGSERIYQLTLATTQNIDAAITGFGAEALDLFLLNACNEITACIAGGGDTISRDALPAGTYYLVVDGETNGDNGPFDITVECNPTAALACPLGCVLNETFEGCAMPAGWTTQVIGGNAWNVVNDATLACAGSNCAARYPYNVTQAANSWLFSGSVALTTGVNYTLRFDRRVRSATFPENMNVWIGTGANAAAMTTQLWDQSGITATTCQTQTVNFTVPANGTYYIGFHAYSAANMFDLLVDNVSVCGPAGVDCSSAQPISCPYTGSGSTVGGTSAFNAYSCSTDTFAGQERMYTFTLADPTAVTVNLSNFGNRDLQAFLLSDCDPCDCIASGTSFTTTLPAGTYTLVVDGFTAADNGPFDLTLDCVYVCLTLPVLTCNAPASGNTTDDANDMNPACGGSAGRDEMWRFTFNGPVGSNLVVSMPAPGWDHVLYVLSSCTDPTSCVGWTDNGSINLTTTTSPQTYYVVVDGYSAGAFGAYSNLLVTCPLPNDIDCAGAVPVACNSTTSGTTVGRPNDASQYDGVNGTFTGGERIYTLTLASTKNIDIYLENHAGRSMYAFLLERNICNVNNVIEGGVGDIHLDGAIAGTYTIVVDGRTPADNGTFDLRVVCNDPGTPPSCGGCEYTVTEPATFSWIDATPGTALVLTDDQNSGFVALPFAFSYHGTSYNQVAVCSNGWISFTDAVSTAYANTALPNVAAPNAMVAPFWDDLDPPLGGTVYYRTTGSAPNRRFTVQWNAVRHHDTTITGTYTFEVVLEETTNAIQFQYQSMADRTQSTIGIENLAGTTACQRYFNNSPAVPPLTNYAIRFVPGASGVNLSCASASAIACNTTVSGSTSGGGTVNSVSGWSCGSDTYAGNERVYTLTLASPQVVDFSLYGFGTRELDLFVLPSCSECACVAGPGDDLRVSLAAGTWTVVVDGFAPSDNGPFQLDVTCASCTDPGAHQRWSVCENPRLPITTATTSALEWNFDDCDYCRDAGNTCFSTPCTFDMYIVAECGTRMHMPLYDNETGNLRIYDMARNQYVYLYAQSTGGWTAEGTQIQWQDCPGTNPNWDNQTTDIWFDGNPSLCGVYRAEFADWGGFIWDLFSNCTGTDTPGFRLYDNYCEALAAYDPLPSLSVESITISGSCPTYTVDYSISNAGCAAASTTVVVSSDLGGSAQQAENNILPGQTRNGSVTLNVQTGGSGVIRAWADFYGSVFECQEAGASATACSVSGGTGSASAPVTCACVIPQFGNVQVEDLTCPVGLRLFWNAAVFASGNGHYDVYRSTVSFADAVAGAPLAASITALEYLDNATTPGSTYYYVVRAEDAAATGNPCVAGAHGGLYTEVNVGPITDNLSQSQDKPYDIGNELRGWRVGATMPHFDWATVVPHANTTHWHVYRSTNAAAIFPDAWSLVCPDYPSAGWLPPGTRQWEDPATPAPLYFYDVRSSNSCEDNSPGVLQAAATSTSPSCNGSGSVAFTSFVTGGVPPFSYSWNFGDGSPASTLPNPTHVYAFPPHGRNATLTVTDSTTPAPQQDVATLEVFAGTAVTATFTHTVNGLVVTFNGTPGGGTGSYTYVWDFGDNTATATVQDPVHTFPGNGTYTVSFRVTDVASRCTIVFSATVSV